MNKPIVDVSHVIKGKIPEPPPWHPVVVDHMPDDPGEVMHYVIVPLPDDAMQWMEENVPNPSYWTAVFFVPTDLVDIEQLRRDLQEFDAKIDQTFPPNYRLVGRCTTMSSHFNVVLPR